MTLIGSKHLPLLATGIATVATAGTPVQLTTVKGKKAVIQALTENNDKIIVIGEAATVDGTTSPPVGEHILFATQTLTKETNDTSEIYIDSDQNTAKVRYSIYG